MTVQTLPLGAPLDYESFRDGAKDLAKRRREARVLLEESVRRHADAEHDYRKARALAYVAIDGQTVAEREIKLDAQTAEHRQIRDVAKGMIDVAKELLEEIDAERASLHRLADWSVRIDPTASEERHARR